MRVVSLTCSNTEIVCALGQGGLLVGVDDHSDFPAAVVAALPRVGPDLQIDVERVGALRPDLVLASLTVPGHERVVDNLTRAGLPVLVLAPLTIADVYEDVMTIGARLGASAQARELVAAMRRELEPAPELSAGPRVLVEWWPKPVIVPGRGSWVNQLLWRAGAVSPWQDRDFQSSPVSDEEVLATNPDAIVIAWCGVPYEKYRLSVVYRRPAWQRLDALRRQCVYRVPEAYLGRPGPRLLHGARAFARIVRELHSIERLSASSI